MKFNFVNLFAKYIVIALTRNPPIGKAKRHAAKLDLEIAVVETFSMSVVMATVAELVYSAGWTSRVHFQFHLVQPTGSS